MTVERRPLGDPETHVERRSARAQIRQRYFTRSSALGVGPVGVYAQSTWRNPAGTRYVP